MNNLTKEGDVRFPNGKKPEALIQKILLLSTNETDLVLDSFLGSGTTAAVAHKMGRRYIGIEMGDHAATHCAHRLRKVIDGEQGGISKAVNWQGGGGFRYFKLGEPVFLPDGGINPAIRFDTLAGYVWYLETGVPTLKRTWDSPFLGIRRGAAYYLLYNGILGDRRPQGGNVLTRSTLSQLPPHTGPKVIYGEITRLNAQALQKVGNQFPADPCDIRMR